MPIAATVNGPATTITGRAGCAEFGNPADAGQATIVGGTLGCGRLGATERWTTDATAGLMLMGVRLYDAETGQFSSVDPLPGANATAYSCPTSPTAFEGSSQMRV
ncbi:RHS repeat-associated core domain-containing protein [Brachybacterium huguangmaarense]